MSSSKEWQDPLDMQREAGRIANIEAANQRWLNSLNSASSASRSATAATTTTATTTAPGGEGGGGDPEPVSVVWLDVDGTCETAEPVESDLAVKNMQERPPLGRAYNYNLPLFEALTNEAAQGVVGNSSVWLFTSYDANGAGNSMSVLRCELLDWLAVAHPQLNTVGVATIIDPAFGRGPGAYYRSVIGPVERALLKKCSACADVCRLTEEDEVETISPDDWTTTVLRTYRDIVLQEQQMVEHHLGRTSGKVRGGIRGPSMDKARLARLCLSWGSWRGEEVKGGGDTVTAPPTTRIRRIIFFDDLRAHLKKVEDICEEHFPEVDCVTVQVTPDMVEVEDYLRPMLGLCGEGWVFENNPSPSERSSRSPPPPRREGAACAVS